MELECPRLRLTHAKKETRKEVTIPFPKTAAILLSEKCDILKISKTTSRIKLTDAYVDGCQQSDPPIEMRHLFLKASPLLLVRDT